MKYKMTLSYDGTEYGGWQIQKNAPSIQAVVEDSLFTRLRTPTHLIASGRTDAGVHAKAQVAHFSCDQPIDTYKLTFGLNSLLPPSIRILSIEQVPDTFHARYSATSKTYHYCIDTGTPFNPFNIPYRYHLPYPINLTLLQQAALYFIGTHDFTSFSNEAHKGSAAHNAVRILERLDIIQAGNELRFEFEGNGFLYKMVRNIVGTLLDINQGKISIDTLPQIFAGKNRSLAGKAAPPQGLFLVEVKYPQFPVTSENKEPSTQDTPPPEATL